MISRALPPDGYYTIITCGYCGVEIIVRHNEQKCSCGDSWFIPKQSKFSKFLGEPNPIIFAWRYKGLFKQHKSTWRYESFNPKELI